MQKENPSPPENPQNQTSTQEADPQNPPVEKDIDLNALFPEEEETDLNELFPNMEMKRLLKKISKNKKDLQTMTHRVTEETNPESD